MGQKDASLFAALATVAKWHLSDFNPQDLADTAWALVTAGIQEPQLMQKIGATATLLTGQFDPAHLLKLIEAYEPAGGNDDSWAKAEVK